MHSFAGAATNNIMKNSLKFKSLDNVTVVMIFFKNLKKNIQPIKNAKNNLNNNLYTKIEQISGKITHNRIINSDKNWN